MTSLLPEQQRFYFLHALDPADPDIYICRTLRIRGEIDTARLRACALDLARRHDVLRSCCTLVDGEPRLVLRDEVTAAVELVDLTADPDAAESYVAREYRIATPFALDTGPLFRIMILALGAATTVVFRFHHLVVDGTSARLLVEELLATYTRPLPRPALQFVDHARSVAPARSEDRTYWSKLLANPPVLDLGTPRPARHTKRAHTVHVSLGADVANAVRQVCRRYYVTPYIVLATLARCLLHGITHQEDLLIGTPVGARPRRELEAMVGVLLDWIAIRLQTSNATSFETVLTAARSEIPTAYAHRCAYERLLAAAGAERDPARSPLFQVTVNYARHEPLPVLPGCEVALDPVEVASTHYDLAFRFEEVGGRIDLGLTGYADVIEPSTLARYAAAFVTLATRCLAAPQAALGDVLPPELRPARRIALAATFTADALKPGLAYWLQRIGLPAEIAIAPIDQVFQMLLDPRPRSGPDVVLVRLADWQDAAHGVRELHRVLATQADRTGVDTIVIATPADPVASPLEDELARVGTHRRVHLVSWRSILARYPVDVIDEPSTAEARAPYTADFEAALALAIARAINAIVRPAPKVLVLDCDGTLWRGVVGEDGPHGIAVEEPHAKLQHLAAAAARDGMLVCLASKNVEADVWAAFAATPGFILTRAQITAHRIDWQPKSANLRALARELGLGLDSFVFLDDSPVECAEVRASCPEVLVFELPAEAAARSRYLDHLWPLDARPTTETDRQRGALYAANARRERVRAETTDLADFVASLAVTTRVVAFSAETAPRAAQLAERTNQFNTTTRRRTVAELEAVVAAGGDVLLVDASDRFGDYGIVGCVVARPDAGVFRVDSFMLSCRALGRGIEQRVLCELGRRAQAAELTHVVVEVRRSPRNQPALAFFDAIGREHALRGTADAWEYGIPVAEALAPRALVASVATEDAAPPPPAPVLHAVWDELAGIDTVARIRREVARALVRSREDSAVFVAPRDELEATIAAIWSEVLLLDGIGVTDDYFAIGGDSIRSLALVARMVAHGLPVSLADVHHQPTVASLATRLRGRPLAVQPAMTSPAATGAYPLGFAQRYVIAAYAAQARTGAFHVQDRFTLRDPRGLAIDALARAVRLVVASTAVLHARVEGLAQHDRATYLDPFVVAPLTSADVEAEIRARLYADRMRPFDPQGGDEAMIRFVALPTSASSCELLVSGHHGFCDGWSLHHLYNRLFELYHAFAREDRERVVAIEHALAAHAHDYRAFVQHEERAAPAAAAFWRAYLAARPLPVRDATPVGYQRRVARRLDTRLLARAVERARATGTSLKAVVLEAAARAFAPASPIAVVTAARPETLPHPTDVFGLCWTYVPVVVQHALGREARLVELHADLLATEAHARLPIADMFGGADPVTVAPVSFNLTHFHHAAWDRIGDLEIVRGESFHRFHFPLNIGVGVGDGLTVKVTSERAEADLHAAIEAFAAELA